MSNVLLGVGLEQIQRIRESLIASVDAGDSFQQWRERLAQLSGRPAAKPEATPMDQNLCGHAEPSPVDALFKSAIEAIRHADNAILKALGALSQQKADAQLQAETTGIEIWHALAKEDGFLALEALDVTTKYAAARNISARAAADDVREILAILLAPFRTSSCLPQQAESIRAASSQQ